MFFNIKVITSILKGDLKSAIIDYTSIVFYYN